MISIGTLTPQDRPAWEGLFRAYNDFYETTLPQDTYDRAWTEFQASERMHALVARVDGRLAGIVHFLVHPSTTSGDVCYLEDLVTAPDVRGRGLGPRPRLHPRVLAHQVRQRHRPAALRQGGRERGLHSVRDHVLDSAGVAE